MRDCSLLLFQEGVHPVAAHASQRVSVTPLLPGRNLRSNAPEFNPSPSEGCPSGVLRTGRTNRWQFGALPEVLRGWPFLSPPHFCDRASHTTNVP